MQTYKQYFDLKLPKSIKHRQKSQKFICKTKIKVASDIKTSLKSCLQ